MASKAVLFDLDGTIIDSSVTLASFVGYLGEKYAKQNLVRINGRTYDLSNSRDLKAVFPEPYYAFYEAIGFEWKRDKFLIKREYNSFLADKLAPMIEGMLRVIQKLSSAGYKLGIVTSNTRPITTSILTSHGIIKAFSSVVCEEDVENPKPHPEPIHKCLLELDVRKENSIYWGDLPGDIECAKAAGLEAGGVTWGFGSYEKLLTASPDYLVDNIQSLEHILGL